MSNANVFGWIRDSVRRAVLLGFSDAVEQVGTVEGNQNINPNLLSMLKPNPGALSASAASVGSSSATATVEMRDDSEGAKPRRRLGRSLDDLRPEAKS